MDQMRSRGFVGADNLELKSLPADILTIVGEIACLGQIVVKVEKYLHILEGYGEGALVRTFEYKYNAFVRSRNNILRYDNAHRHPGHGDAHHKHLFNWRTGRELPGFPQWVGESGWPTLGEVLSEVEQWYYTHREELPNPDAYPELDTRG